jgi:hypothetical protein
MSDPVKTPQPKPISGGVPAGRAWQVGRRIYVACGYESILGGQLREIGAHWDREVKRLWIGSGKKERVLALLAAAEERTREREETTARALWVTIPYSAGTIRERAKTLGAVWDGEGKRWALPTAEAHTEVAGLLALLQEREAAARAEQVEADTARWEAQKQARAEHERAERERAGEAERARRARVVSESGRVAAGEETTLLTVSTEYMNTATARQRCTPVGSVVRMRDGRRALVVATSVKFTDEETASSMCWHRETHDQAHWDLRHEAVVVETTDAEAAADADEQALRADAAEIHRVLRTGWGPIREKWTSLAEGEVAAMITSEYGSAEWLRQRGPRLVLTTSGVWLHQSPPAHDELHSTEREVADPAATAAAAAVLAAGNRDRGHVDQLRYWYTVTMHDTGSDSA